MSIRNCSHKIMTTHMLAMVSTQHLTGIRNLASICRENALDMKANALFKLKIFEVVKRCSSNAWSENSSGCIFPSDIIKMGYAKKLFRP